MLRSPRVPGAIPTVAAAVLALVIMPGHFVEAAPTIVSNERSDAQPAASAKDRKLLDRPSLRVGEDGLTIDDPRGKDKVLPTSDVIIGTEDGTFDSVIRPHDLIPQDQPVSVSVTGTKVVKPNGEKKSGARVDITSSATKHKVSTYSSISASNSRAFDVDHKYPLSWKLTPVEDFRETSETKPTPTTSAAPEHTPTQSAQPSADASAAPSQNATPGGKIAANEATVTPTQTPTGPAGNDPTPSETPTPGDQTTPSDTETPGTEPTPESPISDEPDVSVFCVAVTVSHVRETFQLGNSFPATVPTLTQKTNNLTVVVGKDWKKAAQDITVDCDAKNKPSVNFNDADMVELDPPNASDPTTNEPYYKVENDTSDLGFTFGGAAPMQQFQFNLIDAPEGATAHYRNGTVNPHTKKPVKDEPKPGDKPGSKPTEPKEWAGSLELRRNTVSKVRHRANASRDLFATWKFSKPGVYCVGYGTRGITQEGAPDEWKDFHAILKFVVGGADPASVDCKQSALFNNSGLRFPITAPAVKEEEPTPHATGTPTTSATPTTSETPTATSTPTEATETPEPTESATVESGDDATDEATDGATDGATNGASATPTADPNVKIVRAPSGVKMCPADIKGQQQLRSGNFIFHVADDIKVSNRKGNRSVPTDSTSVVSQSATRTAQAGIADFVDPQGTYWATGGAGASAPSFEWNTSESKDEVEISMHQISGPGDAIVFGPESDGPGLSDGDTGKLAPRESGALTFGFNKVGEYELELKVGSKGYKMKFAVGDTVDTARSLVTSNILSSCAGSAVQQNLLQPSDDEPEQTEAKPHEKNIDQVKGQLGDEWWTISIAGIVLAAILIGFIVMVVLNSRRY
ncbi:hypothetical protein GCM10009585_01110 [Brevibacterium paucivorans]